MLKKLLCLTALFAMFLTGCSFVGTLNDLYNSDSLAEDGIAVADDTLIEAIQNKDIDLMRSLFSEAAKSLSSDIDNDIMDMFEVYKGDFIKYTQKNHSSEYNPGENESMYLNPVRVFQTTEGYFKLSWNEFTKYKKNSDMVGIYSLKLEEWPDEGLNEGGQVLPLAGVVTPYNSYINDIAIGLLKVVCDLDHVTDYKENFKNLFSDDILITEQTISDFFEMAYDFKVLRNDTGQVVTDSSNSQYICFFNTKHQKYMIFRIDKDHNDKISYLKLGYVEEGSTIEKYIPEKSENGIFI